MKYLKLFENFESKLTMDYLQQNHPIELDEFYLSNFRKERFYVMIDDKASYYTSEIGFNQTKNALYLILEKKGLISDNRVDVPIIKQYLRSALDKKILIWIHGLPGSGKSSVAIEKQGQLPDRNFIILDDIGNMEDVENLLKKGENIILTSPYFENYSFTKNFVNLKEKMKSYTNYFVLHLWFENDAEACINNLKSRTGHKIDSKYIIPEMQDFSKKYKIPPGARKIPVYIPK
jgi:hypothetical protein